MCKLHTSTFINMADLNNFSVVVELYNGAYNKLPFIIYSIHIHISFRK